MAETRAEREEGERGREATEDGEEVSFLSCGGEESVVREFDESFCCEWNWKQLSEVDPSGGDGSI